MGIIYILGSQGLCKIGILAPAISMLPWLPLLCSHLVFRRTPNPYSPEGPDTFVKELALKDNVLAFGIQFCKNEVSGPSGLESSSPLRKSSLRRILIETLNTLYLGTWDP